ncbi:MAG: TetR/AcrR family transcriptional regulator [Christensenellales bacterium]|jgi:AcrR family transcriptional regulator
MEIQKSDRRIRKTQALLRKNLTQLLKEKELKNISVSELTQRADINRSTFYLHYKDIYDLFEQIENEAMEGFMGIITKYRHQGLMPLTPIMLELFQYISSNADIFIAILNNKESTFLEKVLETNRPKNKKEWEVLLPTGKEEYYEYYYVFFTSGCIELIRCWFNNGMRESARQIAELAERLMGNSIKDLA